MGKYTYICPFTCLLVLLLSGCSSYKDNLQYVDPFIGTDATHFISDWRSEACTYPGAVAPHGIVQISPETSAPGDYLQGYYYSQDTIRRFSMAEHFSGWPDGSHGKGVIMPFTQPGNSEITLRTAASHFSHDREEASPGYYSVYLDDSKIKCRFASLTRSGIGSFIFEGQGERGVILEGVRSLVTINETELELKIASGSGYIGKSDNPLNVLVAFDHPYTIREKGRQYILTFPGLVEENELKFKIGASYTSPENARLNLNAEIPAWDVDVTRSQAEWLWEKVLNRVEIVKGEEEDKTMFYTALYHGSLIPMNATDINGQYPGYQNNVPLEEGETHYIYFSPWDAFRTLYPMINFLYPEKGRDYMRSLVRIYHTAGRLPEPEVMTSVHISVLVADALARGIDDFDVKTAFRGLTEMILEPPYFRPDMALYDSLGYVPFPHRYATTATLEFAFNDWALSRVAEKVGEKELADKLLRRSLNYRNNYNPENRFMESKHYDGTWSYAPLYAEADKWNMSWFAPHDTRGLINLMGGDEAFCNHLERNFSEGHFVLDNECPMNFPFLFSYAGKPWKSMEWKNKTLRYYFNNSPGGIPGNDDWGTMSGWYAWGALGFFPVCPGTEELVITGPVFEKFIIHRPDGKELVIEAENVTGENIYIQNCLVDGREHDQCYMLQSELLDAGSIRFIMGNQPDKQWGLAGPDPYSVTDAEPEFEILEFNCSGDKVRSHDMFSVTIKIKNTGAPGSYPLQITRDNNIIYSGYPLIEQGKTADVKVPLRLYAGGTSTLAVEKMTRDIEVQPANLPPEKAFKFSAPLVDAFIQAGDSIRFRCRVQNISGFESKLAPAVFLDSSQAGTLKLFHLNAGGSAELAGSLPPLSKTGFYNLSIQSGPPALFKIFNNPEETLALDYTFDETGQQVTDHSGFGNHGRIIGELEYVNGIKGNGIKVLNGYVEVPESGSLAIEDEELTMICWYRPGTKKGASSLITKGGHNMMKLNNKWQLKLAIGGWGVGQCVFNVPVDPATGEPVWTGQWSHFAGTRADDQLYIYYNGEQVSQLAVTGTIGSTDFRWCVGTNAEIPIGRTPDGVIDEVMIFAKALSEKQIREIYQNLIPITTTSSTW